MDINIYKYMYTYDDKHANEGAYAYNKWTRMHDKLMIFFLIFYFQR